jgi:arylsulfatase A-like enzyme
MKSLQLNTPLKPASGIALTALASLAFTNTQAQQTEKTNVIFMMVDDLGFADVEVYGNQYISTPNINKLARNGMTFTQMYASCSVSAPTRASLMTGEHTGRTKIRGNREISPEGQEPLDPTVRTIAHVFKTAGYTTGAFGKWGLGFPGSGSEPTDVGFDRFYGYNCQRQSHFFYPPWIYDNKTKITLDKQFYAQDLIQQEALKFIRDNKDQPFFGYFAYLIPHASLEQPNDSLYQQYTDKFCETPYVGSHYTSAAKPRAMFAGMVSRLDEYVGEIMAELEAQGILENTLFIFTSDNGPHNEGGADPSFFNSEKRLKGYKRALHEGGIRIPFIARWDKHIAPGSINNHIGVFYDMMPTFVELTGQSERWTQRTDGVSMLPTLSGAGEQQRHDYLYWEFHEENGRQAVRRGPWKLIRQNIRTNPTLELYNLDDDLGETNNLASKYPETVQELSNIMENTRTHSTLFNFGR